MKRYLSDILRNLKRETPTNWPTDIPAERATRWLHSNSKLIKLLLLNATSNPSIYLLYSWISAWGWKSDIFVWLFNLNMQHRSHNHHSGPGRPPWARHDGAGETGQCFAGCSSSRYQMYPGLLSRQTTRKPSLYKSAFAYPDQTDTTSLCLWGGIHSFSYRGYRYPQTQGIRVYLAISLVIIFTTSFSKVNRTGIKYEISQFDRVPTGCK